MEKQEILFRLNEIIKSGKTKREIEDALGLPANNLSSILTGAKNLPSKYIDAAIVYINENTPNGQREPLETNLSVTNIGQIKETATPKRISSVSLTVEKINKDFGAGTVMKFGDRPQKGYKIISTGSISLDAAIGIGGLPRGRMIEIYGPESSGKTTICLHVIANAQKEGLRCLLVDAENSFDPEYAESLGVDCQSLDYCQPTFGEEGFEVADRMITNGDIDVVVIDSVAAMIPKGELDGETGDAKMGLHARLMSQVCRKLVGVVAKKEVLMIFINQIRNKIGVVYGSPEVVTGGMALQFYASVRLDVRRKEAIKDGEEVLGNRTRVKVVKNKCAPPMKYAEFDIVYGSGINREGEILDLAVTKGVIMKSGSWYSYGGQKLGQGKDSVVQLLTDNPEMAEEIYQKCLQ